MTVVMRLGGDVGLIWWVSVAIVVWRFMGLIWWVSGSWLFVSEVPR